MCPLPVIGLPCTRIRREEIAWTGQGLGQTYVHAVITAGGAPMLIPVGISPEAALLMFKRIDALLLAGGPDVRPAEYGQADHPKLGDVDPDRDATELVLARQALKDGMPILGICRGIQMLNVAAGGTLIQDIESQRPGSLVHPYMTTPERRKAVAHYVMVDEGSRLARALGSTRVDVNSGHHQAVDHVAPGFRIVARAPDGIIEGIEREQGYAVGVQWHPEEFVGLAPWALNLFQSLVAAAKK
jgi:putative glutamine amidotransferase